MEIATGYFISREPALEAARTLSRQGFKIEVLGQRNREDFRKGQMAGGNAEDLEAPYFGVMGGTAGVAPGISGYMVSGTGLLDARTIVSLVNEGTGSNFKEIMINWGVPEDIEKEISSVIDSGRSVVMVECEAGDKGRVRELLVKQGAQNIHI